jgi:hypothetical protein
MKRNPTEIIAGMDAWWDGRQSADVRTRSDRTRAYDSGIMIAAEYIRRRTGDEDLAFEVHSLLSTKLPKH